MQNRASLSLFILLMSFTCTRAQVFMRTFNQGAEAGLAGASVAFTGTQMGVTNEAQLAQCDKFGVLATTALPYSLSDWNVAKIQAWVKSGEKSGFSLQFNTSGIESYREQAIGIAYGRQFLKNFALGISADYLTANAAEYGSKNGMTFGIGITSTPTKNLSFGFQAINPAQLKVADIDIRTALRIGVQYHPSNVFSLLAETEKDLDHAPIFKMGVNYQPHKRVFVRLGARTKPAKMGIGAGIVALQNLRIDIGGDWHPTLGFTPSFGIQYAQPPNKE